MAKLSSLSLKRPIVRKEKANRYKLKSQVEIQSMVWLGLIFVVIFCYLPMYGIVVAFQDYNIIKGFFASQWVGLKYFREFMTDHNFFNVLYNTLGINLLGSVIAFPAPILFALFLNEISSEKLKKSIQTVSYLPHFISWIVFGGMVINFFEPGAGGILNNILRSFGLIDKSVNFIGNPDYIWIIIVSASVAKGIGWGAIIYIAAIAGIDQTMYEAATIDGANRFQKIRYITLPAIVGTIMIMLIFQISSILNTGFDQIIVMQNPLNIVRSETIDTYVYKVGLGQFRFAYATAVGLFKSLVAVILLVLANVGSKKITGNGLF